MSKTVTKSWSSAGYLPGQHQTVTVTFNSRANNRLKVSWHFYAKDNGYDTYDYNQRHNRMVITINGYRAVYNYQARCGSSVSKSGAFYVNNVPNGTTSLPVYYSNSRIWVDGGNPGDPRSTGVVSKTKIGTLTVPDNVKYNITYNNGYPNGSVKNLPSNSTGVYSGTSYKISSNILTDVANHYVFAKGYTTSAGSTVNTAKPTVSLGSSQTLSSNVTYYACWTPQTYKYRFFTTSALSSEYKSLATTYTYSKKPTVLPNLNTLSKDNTDTTSIYYKTGYKFGGWNSARGKVVSSLACKYDSNTNFYPIWNKIKSKFIFNYGFDDYTREVECTYDSQFDFRNALKDSVGDYKSSTLLRPGYKLIGWTFNPIISNTIYEPFKAPKVNYSPEEVTTITFASSLINNKQFEELGLNLYAVWEYYSTMFVYTEGTWKLVLPYVYSTIDSTTTWRISLSYDYTSLPDSQNPTWKL